MKTQTPSERFNKELSSYQIFVLLSIFVDILFVFTILSAMNQQRLNELFAKGDVSDNQKSNFSTWKTIFTIGIIVRVLLFCCGGGTVIGSGYLSGYNSSNF